MSRDSSYNSHQFCIWTSTSLRLWLLHLYICTQFSVIIPCLFKYEIWTATLGKQGKLSRKKNFATSKRSKRLFFCGILLYLSSSPHPQGYIRLLVIFYFVSFSNTKVNLVGWWSTTFANVSVLLFKTKVWWKSQPDYSWVTVYWYLQSISSSHPKQTECKRPDHFAENIEIPPELIIYLLIQGLF